MKKVPHIERRRFVKNMAALSATTVASSLLPGVVFGQNGNKKNQSDELKWHKAPCQLCSVGCGLLVGVQKGRTVAVKGDPNSAVNQGLCCTKGYHSIIGLSGADRITKPMVRKGGQLVSTTWAEALSTVAKQMKKTISQKGKDGVSMYCSGKQSIVDGYIASKFMKGGVGTNNLESDSRLSAGAALSGLDTTFGTNSTLGCYEDIDHADTFVMWGSNIAETHPILFLRILQQEEKQKHKRDSIKIVTIDYRETRTMQGSTDTFLINPQSELALANAIAHEVIASAVRNDSFIESSVVFKTGKTELPNGKKDKETFTDELSDSYFEAYKTFLQDYTPEKVSKIVGLSPQEIRTLARYYTHPNNDILSIWGMQVNQTSRGTWLNNLLHNLHLLSGKIAKPGNNTLPLSAQASDYGTSAGVGLFTDRLPSGHVTDEKARSRAAEVWGVSAQDISQKETYHAVEMFRALDRGDIGFMWIQQSNPVDLLPNGKRYKRALRKEGRFVVVSDSYPTATTDIADVVLPTSAWVEAAGMYSNVERRVQSYQKMVSPKGGALTCGEQIIAVSKQLGYDQLFPWGKDDYVEKAWEEYSKFHTEKKNGLPQLSTLKKEHGIIAPYVDGASTQWRFNPSRDMAVEGDQVTFYDNPNGKANIIARPHQSGGESPNKQYPMWLITGEVLEHGYNTPSTRRIPQLHRSVPKGYVELNKEDAKRLGVKSGDSVRVSTPRGSVVIQAFINKRSHPNKGIIFAPLFDEGYPINDILQDVFCPIGKASAFTQSIAQISRA